MIINFLKESEVKCVEYMIIKNNICTTMEDINNALGKDFKNNNKMIDYYKNKQKEDKKKEDNKKDNIKKEDNKKKDNKYKYNLLSLLLLLKKKIFLG